MDAVAGIAARVETDVAGDIFPATLLFYHKYCYLWVVNYVIRPPMATREIIANITAQVHRLMEQHARQAELCERLKAEGDALRREKRALQERVRELETELSRMQLADGLGGGTNREQARMRVNRLMREVDKCIALLNRQQE